MITFIAFLLTIIGSINWLLIGLLQYDFIAGFFGFQASIFSRLCYILIGAGCLYLIIRIIVNKGNLKVWERKEKKKKETELQPIYNNNNIEPANENVGKNNDNKTESEKAESEEQENGLFDEHLKEK